MQIGSLEIQLRADLARLSRDMDASRRIVGDATQSISRSADMAKNALAGIAAGLGLSQLIALSDHFTKFTAQLRLASLSAREYAAAYGEVKRIANDAQQDLQATGVLYARIANGTRELGTTQKQVAAITETVNMALKVSGATASESASAQLQLSQAFASGTLRGEEFNAVNEAAPRLMLALADGIGVPVGALKKMAEAGEITSKIMADVLPNALVRLREEAKEVQTIAGAFTVLKNNVMEFVGIQANANGGVAMLTGAIGLLASNLSLLAGAFLTVVAVKTGTWMAALIMDTQRQITANAALRASTLAGAVATTEAAAVASAAKLAEAQASTRAAASASMLAAARVSELRAAVAGASGAVALAIATNGLIPAQARAIALAEAHAIALGHQAVAGNAATTAALASTAALTAQTVATTFAARAMAVLRGAMAFLGGPIGLVITLLGAAATAWMVWGDKSKESNDKALASVDETTTEMISRLDKQIEKLKERNRLQDTEPRLKGLNDLSDADKDGLARAKAALDANRGQPRTGLAQLEEIDLSHRYETALLRVGQAQDEVTAAANRGRNTKIAEWYAQNGTQAQRLAAELAELKKKFGEIPPEMEKLVRAKYADKGAATAIRQEATAYQNLITAIGEKIAANKLDISGNEKLTESQKMTIKLDEAIASGKNKLTPKHIEEARALIGVVAGQEAVILARNLDIETAKRSAGANADNLDILSKTTIQMRADALAQQDQNDRIGLGTVALAEMDAQRLEHLAGIKDENAELAELIDWTGAMSEAYRNQAKALRERAGAMRVGASKDGNDDVTRAKNLLDIMVQVDEATKSAAQGMAESFGKVGSAIGSLTTALSGYGRAQATIAAQLKASTKEANGDPAKIAQANILASRQSAQAQIKSYGDMAGAAKGFFKENSTGYKVMEGAEKAFRAAEMAMAIQNMLSKSGLLTAFTSLFVASKATEKTVEAGATAASGMQAATQASAWGVTAVVKALASLPFPANLAAGAATLAAVVAIGAKIAGGIGGGSGGGQSAADAQKSQGAGGVFGDTNAVSASILRSLEFLEKNSESLIPINRGMLSALNAIRNSMVGLTNLLVREPGLTNGTNMGIETGQLNIGKQTDGISTQMTLITKTLFAGFGDKIASFVNNLWGKTTQSIVDSGLQFGGSLRGLQSGQGFNQYASVDTTKSSLFGLSKKTTNSLETQGLSSELTAQFGQIFTNVEKALAAAAAGLGIGSASVTAALDALVIDVTKVSLKGLTGSALTEALNAVISKTMDEMAQAAIPGMDAFRQVGEGYAETVIRLASNYAQLDATLQSIGMTFGATGVSSLTARENLIAMAGGIDKFTEQAGSFAQNFLTEAERLAPVQKYVTDELARMGLAGVTTRDQFRDVVLGLDLSTAAGAQTYASLMALQEPFALVVPAIEAAGAAVRSLADIASEASGLKDQLAQLSMSPVEYERSKIAPENLGLFDQVQDKAAANDLIATNKTYLDQLHEMDRATMTSIQLRADDIKGMDASTVVLYDLLAARNAEAKVMADAKVAADAMAATNKTYADQILAIDKLTMTSAQIRALDIAGMDESTVKLYDLLVARRAENKAGEDLKAANKSWQDQLDALNKSHMTAEQLRELETKNMDASTLAIYDSFQARKAELSAIEQANSAAKAISAGIVADMDKRSAGTVASQTNATVEIIDLSNQRAAMELSLFKLTHTAQENLAEDRRRELDAMDATLRPLQMQINAQQDLASAAEESARRIDAIAAERGGLQREMFQLTGNTAALRKLEVEALDPSNRALKESIFALQDKMAADQAAAAAADQWAQAVAAAAAESRRAADELKKAWQGATDSIFDEVARIRGLAGSGSGTESLASAQARFTVTSAQARSGDQEAAKLLPGLSQALLTLAESNAVTTLDLRRIQAQTAASLMGTGSGLAAQFGLNVPSFDVGTNYVTSSGLAMIHEGEEIRPAGASRPFTSDGGDTSALEEKVVIMTKAISRLESALDKIARDSNRVANIQQGIADGDIIPQVEVVTP